jgi:predicted phosphodiesterase
MTTDRLAKHRAVVALVEQCLTEGFTAQWIPGPGNRQAAHEAASRWKKLDGSGISYSGFKGMLEKAKEAGIEPDWSLYKAYRYQQPMAKYDMVPAPAPRVVPAQGEPKRVLVIPDRHNDPRHPHRLEVSTWIMRYGSEHRHDYVVCLGDALTMDSCSRHDKNDTLRGRHKPSIRQDIDNQLAMLQAEELGRDPSWKPKKRKTRGNHEQRLFDFENQHPESEGTHTHAYAQNLLQFGWQESAFGEIIYIEGVGFTHAPMANGRPRGGINAPRATAIDQCESLVHGHTHALNIHTSKKNGPTDKVHVIQAGCALPEGEIEHYATHGGATGWSYGILDLTVCAGEIIDFAWVSMRTLRQRYATLLAA